MLKIKKMQHDQRCEKFVSGKYLKHIIYNHVQCTFYVKSYLNIESKHGFPIYDHTCTIICSRKTFLSNFVNQRKVYRESVTFIKEWQCFEEFFTNDCLLNLKVNLYYSNNLYGQFNHLL